jgi:predicted acyltransferase
MASAILLTESQERFARRVPTKTSSSAKSRLLSLDVYRGLTILAMILVNNPGTTDGYSYWPLQHAVWHNPTPTDLIFPTFLFIVGTSLAYSLRKYRDDAAVDSDRFTGGHRTKPRIEPVIYWRIASRTLMLILLGLFLALSAKLFNYAFGNSSTITLTNLRLPGILQRIGLVYCAVALVALHIRPRGQAFLAAAVLSVYWALLAWLPNPGNLEANYSPEGNLVRLVDRAILTDAHMYTQSTDDPTDPEGLLSTLPSIVTAMFGYWAGLFIQRRGVTWNSVLGLMTFGAVCIVIAAIWHPLFPINKRMWTSSFVFLAGGVSLQLFALCLLVFDVQGWRRFAWPFQIAGINAIFVFVGTGLVDRALLRMPAPEGDSSARQWLYDAIYQSWIADPKLASLGYALTMVAIWWVVLYAMARRGWVFRV